MEPVKFKEQTVELLRPSNMTDDECGPLPVFRNGNTCISKWKLNWKEKLHVLFKGYVWLGVYSGRTQPPVKVSTEYPFEV